MAKDLITLRPQGLYCEAGDFYIDPWRPVDRAVITHAHADHARSGSQHYLASARGEHVLRSRLGKISLECLDWGEKRQINGVSVSLHSAGHVLGSAQVRVEHRGQIWVASGDYKTEPDSTCDAFEPVECDTFITESTFGLPVYRWQPPAQVFADMSEWWSGNAANGQCSVLYAYSFGKAQRILSGVDASIGPIVCHGAVAPLNEAYRSSGVTLPDTFAVGDVKDRADLSRALVVAPPSAAGSSWLRRFGKHSDAFASGWMRLRGARRRRALDRGFVLSDHADWPGLQTAISATGASRVIVTHGYEAVMVRWLQDQGLQAQSFQTEFAGEAGSDETTASDLAS
ncbi:MAG: ligase-associated DNA damage response exonuclease [Burkholderiaceae bacterium]